jgi:hypothetical protein
MPQSLTTCPVYAVFRRVSSSESPDPSEAETIPACPVDPPASTCDTIIKSRENALSIIYAQRKLYRKHSSDIFEANVQSIHESFAKRVERVSAFIAGELALKLKALEEQHQNTLLNIHNSAEDARQAIECISHELLMASARPGTTLPVTDSTISARGRILLQRLSTSYRPNSSRV